MKQTDTFKYELLLRLCDEAAHDNEAVELAPQDILPHYGERDTQAERKQAAHFFSAVQSLESLRIVRMKKSRRDGATYVDSIVLEDPEAAAAELAKFERRLEQEAREAAYRERQQAASAEEDEASEAEVSEAYGALEEVGAQKPGPSEGAEEAPSGESADESASSGSSRPRRGRGRRSSGPVDPRITREACEYLEEVDAPLTPRELSLLVTGDTKKIDKTGLKRLASTLRRKNSASSNQGALTDAGVIADLKTICIKGPIVLITDRGAIDASILPNGISMFDVDLPNIDRSYVRASRIITVENLDAYRRCNGDDVYIYTEGSVSPRHRALLRMIHEQNPQVEFAHFGDIDYAGIKAHRVIEETLGCEVGMFHMGIAELANPSYRKAIHPLTSKDRDLLARLLEYERYRGLVPYMLERNVKLEQEIVALDLFSDYDVDAAMALPEGRGAADEPKPAPARAASRSRARRSNEGTYKRQARQNTTTRPEPAAASTAPAPSQDETPARAQSKKAAAQKPAAPKPAPAKAATAKAAPAPAEAQAAEKPAPSHQETPAAPEVAATGEEAAAPEPEKRTRRRTRKPRAKAATSKGSEATAVDASPEAAPETPAAPSDEQPVTASEEPAKKPKTRAKSTRTRKPKAAQVQASSAEGATPAPETPEQPEAPAAEAAEPSGEPKASKASKAKASRQYRREMEQQRQDLLANVTAGKVSALDLMDAVDDLARSIPVIQLLAALPGWDHERAQAFMDQESISHGRTLRGLGKRQQARVREAIREQA